MKDELKKLRSIKKTWASTSIAEEVKQNKKSKKIPTDSFIKKLSKTDFFPIDSLHRHDPKTTSMIVNPDSLIKIIWDVILLICLMMRFYIIPYQLSFSQGMLPQARGVILFTDCAFIIDIALRFNTGFHLKGFLVTDRLAIVKNYLKKTLVVDLIGSIPFQEMMNLEQISEDTVILGINYLKFLLLLKFIHLYRIKVTFYELEDRFTSIHTVTLLKFLHFSMLISLMIHWTSCLVYVSYLQSLEENGDLWYNYIENESFRYLNYLYFILFTVTSIGYYALNISETDTRLITVMIMCCDIIIFAYILGKIQSTLNSYQKDGNETKRLLGKCKSFISQNKIPNSLRYKILKYISFCREKERKSVDKENEILCNLSLPLREEIFTQTRGFILARQNVFKMYQKSFLKFIGYHLKLQIFGPDDGIFDEGENSSTTYFIQNGEVEIFHAATSTTYKVLKKGKSFGEIGFFLETTRTASAKSTKFSELLILTRATFNKILLSRPQEKSITDDFISQAHKLGLMALGIKCYLCKISGHVASDCKNYKIKIDLKKIIKKIDKTKYTGSKKVNLNEAYRFTFQRSEAAVNSKEMNKIYNVKGEKDSLNSKFKGKPALIKKAMKFHIKNTVDTKKVDMKSALVDESSESDKEASPLPLSMQYRNAFIEKSRQRKRMGENVIELFEAAELPKIYVNSPPEGN